MWKRRTFAQLLAAFVLARLQVLAQAVAPTGERLGLKGYDPVAYFTDGKAQPGAPEFEYAWDGVRYRFASAAHRDLFKGIPDKYAPQLGGSCAMNISDGVRREAGGAQIRDRANLRCSRWWASQHCHSSQGTEVNI